MLGTINRDWYDNAIINTDAWTITQWFAEITNRQIDILLDLSVWDGTHYLSQAEIDAICSKIDNQN